MREFVLERWAPFSLTRIKNFTKVAAMADTAQGRRKGMALAAKQSIIQFGRNQMPKNFERKHVRFGLLLLMAGIITLSLVFGGIPAYAQAKAAVEANPAAPPTEAAKKPPKTTTQAPAKLIPGQKVNLNTATKEQIEALPEVGPAKAQAIIAGRPYKSTEDLMKVKGIKQGTFNKLKDLITVE